MERALARHDELLRSAITRHGGHVFKTVGDAFCAAFWSPSNAVDAAIDGQYALAAEDFSAVEGLRVRMAIHCGVVQERDGDYFGPTVNRVARLLSLAYGGQTLVSQIAAEICRGLLPDGVALRDLGSHRLKDIPHPETVFQLLIPGLQEEFPPLRSSDWHPNNLPLQLASFLGRQNEMKEIEALLRASRLVTLTGSGGVGKTRTALEIGARLLHEYPDGVWFVDLAPLVGAQLVPDAIAAVFDIQPTGTRPVLDDLVGTLKPKHALILLDNCEHVVATAAEVTDHLLRRCPRLQILATSREALNVAGESVFPMPVLPEETAIALFAERAKAVQGRFELDERNRPIVTVIMRRLDGIPLAIELAASRVKLLSVDRIAEALDERFTLLVGGSRTALPRQQTLRALIGWSYDLLTDAERSMLRQLAVFHGSCTLDAVMEVCIDEHSADWDVLQGLESLVEKSLLIADVANAEPRYRMLESTREYALERLREAGDYEAATTRHCAYFVRESERRFDEFWQVNLDDWNAAVRPDLDNFRSAITRALENDNDLNSGVLLAANLVRVNSREFREILIRAATTDTSRLPERTRARLALALAIALIDHRSFLEHAFAAVESLERIGSRVELADARLMEAVAMFRAGRNADLAQHAEATLALARASGAPRLLAYTQGFFGCWLILRGDRERGLELLDKAVRTFRSLGDKGRLSLQLINYADALFSSNDVSGALDNAVEALELCMERGDTSNASRIHINMSGYLLSQDHAAEAWICVREGLQGAVALGLGMWTAVAIGHLAEIAARADDLDRAARLLGYTDNVFARSGFTREPPEERSRARTMTLLQNTISERRLTELFEQGALLDDEAAVREGMSVPLPLEDAAHTS